MSVTRFCLVRHGETEWNAVGRIQGTTDIDLNDKGRWQASMVAQALTDAGITAIYSSDLKRAANTAKIIGEQLALEPHPVAQLRERNYGRIVITTSSSGLFGNFGQANYGAAKAGMVGLMNVLAEEGRKNNIRVNTISPTAATRMTEELLPPQALSLMRPEAITPAVEFLLSEDASFITGTSLSRREIVS